MAIDEVVQEELRAYLKYAELMTGGTDYSDPEYKRMINNVLGGNRFGGVAASL